MSTPIATNTEELRNILQQVNELPSGGGSGTGSGSFQRTTGSFTTNTSGVATATCGFQPDLIHVYTITYDGFEEGFTIPFAEQTNPSNQYCALGYWDNGIYEVKASKTTNGFSVEMKDLGWGSSQNIVKSKQFSYIAVKYT